MTKNREVFMDFLKDFHAESYHGLADEMEKSFENWLKNLDKQELVNLAETFVRGQVEKEKFYLIWSLEHKAWWGRAGNGYRKDRIEAGLYTFDEASKIVKDANIGLHDIPSEAMVEFIEAQDDVVVEPTEE
jgi:hypothetical protein